MPRFRRCGLLLSLSLLAGCAAASGTRSGTPAGNDSGSPAGITGAPASCPGCSCEGEALVPAFCPDGRLRRDAATDAPVFLAAGPAVLARAPRFNDDGTVCRDCETGSPVFEEVSDGRVVRVIVLPR